MNGEGDGNEGGVRALFEEALTLGPVPGSFPEWMAEEDFPFLIGAFAGRGGSGRVWKGQRKSGGEAVAVKVIPLGSLGNGADLARERWLREARLVGEIDHPVLVRVLDHGISPDGRDAWLAMNWVEGRTLAELICKEGPLQWARVLQMTRQLCDGLGAVHAQGIAHRDLKPANIMVSDNREEITILDFGVAASSTGERLTRTGEAVISLGYSAPEQGVPGQMVDVRSDQFSLAVTVWQALSKRLPQGAFGPLESDAPGQVEAVLRKAMNPDPDQRFADVSGFGTALEISAKSKRSFLKMTSLGVAALVCLGGFLFFDGEEVGGGPLLKSSEAGESSRLFSEENLSVKGHEDASASCYLYLKLGGVAEGLIHLRNKSRLFGTTVTLLVVLYDEKGSPILALNAGHYGVTGTFNPGGPNERTDFFRCNIPDVLLARASSARFQSFATNSEGRDAYFKRARDLQKELAERGGIFVETRRSRSDFNWWDEKGLKVRVGHRK